MQPVGTPIPSAASSSGRSRGKGKDRTLANSLPQSPFNKSSSTTSLAPLRAARVKNNAPTLVASVAEFLYKKVFDLQGQSINWVKCDEQFHKIIIEFQSNFSRVLECDNLKGKLKWMSPEEGCTYFNDMAVERKLRGKIFYFEDELEKKTIWRIGTVLFYLHTGSLHPMAKILHCLEQGQLDQKTAHKQWREEVQKLISDRDSPEHNLARTIIWQLLRAKPGARFSFNEVYVNFKARIS